MRRPNSVRTPTTWILALAAAGGLAVSAQAQSSGPQHPYLADFFVEYDKPAESTMSSTSMGRAPVADQQTMQKYERLIGEVVDPENTMDIVVGRPRVLRLNETPVRIQIPDEEVASYLLISDREISINGIEAGTTLLNIWFPNPDDRRNPRILSYLVRVIPDPEERAKVERTLDALEKELNAAFPESLIELVLVGEKVVVRGQAATARDAEQIIGIVSSSSGVGEDEQLPVGDGPSSGPSIEDYIVSTNRQIVNQLTVTGEAQINLRVTIAEVNRSATRSIGTNWVVTDNDTDLTIGQLTAGLLDGGLAGTVQTADVNVPISYVSGTGEVWRIALNALRSLNLARSLAEPNLVALNGRAATLKSGGEFPIPVVAGGTDSGLLGVEFESFGIIMSFTPYVTGKDRIRLEIDFEASTRSNESSLSVGSGSVGGLDTRSFNNIVELSEGETLAVAGLVQTNFSSGSARVPFLGDLPVVGHFFGTSSTSHGEQELMILVTPEIVYPMKPGEVGPLPGTGVYEPSDLEFYLLNKLESNYLEDWRSSVRTDIVKQFGGRNYPYYVPDRISPFEQMRRSENMLISGPSGHSDYKMR